MQGTVLGVTGCREQAWPCPYEVFSLERETDMNTEPRNPLLQMCLCHTVCCEENGVGTGLLYTKRSGKPARGGATNIEL